MTTTEQAAFDRGLAAGKEESALTIRKLREALDKALAENLSRRPKPFPSSRAAIPFQ